MVYDCFTHSNPVELGARSPFSELHNCFSMSLLYASAAVRGSRFFISNYHRLEGRIPAGLPGFLGGVAIWMWDRMILPSTGCKQYWLSLWLIVYNKNRIHQILWTKPTCRTKWLNPMKSPSLAPGDLSQSLAFRRCSRCSHVTRPVQLHPSWGSRAGRRVTGGLSCLLVHVITLLLWLFDIICMVILCVGLLLLLLLLVLLVLVVVVLVFYSMIHVFRIYLGNNENDLELKVEFPAFWVEHGSGSQVID